VLPETKAMTKKHQIYPSNHDQRTKKKRRKYDPNWVGGRDTKKMYQEK
jgi:hypothetical protein